MAPEADKNPDPCSGEGTINVRIDNDVGDVDKTKVSRSDLRGDGANNQIGKDQNYQTTEVNESHDEMTSLSRQNTAPESPSSNRRVKLKRSSVSEDNNIEARQLGKALQEVTSDAGRSHGGAQTANAGAAATATLEPRPPPDFSLKELSYFTEGTVFKIWHPRNNYLHDMTFIIFRSANVKGSIAEVQEFEDENEAEDFMGRDNVEFHYAELRDHRAQTPRKWEDNPLIVQSARNRGLKKYAFVKLNYPPVLNFCDPHLFVKNRGMMNTEQLARLQEKIRKH